MPQGWSKQKGNPRASLRNIARLSEPSDIEPQTYRLRSECSTTELRRRMRVLLTLDESVASPHRSLNHRVFHEGARPGHFRVIASGMERGTRVAPQREGAVTVGRGAGYARWALSEEICPRRLSVGISREQCVGIRRKQSSA